VASLFYLFIEWKDIAISLVKYKNTVFPLCTYKDKPLPYAAGIKIAILSSSVLRDDIKLSLEVQTKGLDPNKDHRKILKIGLAALATLNPQSLLKLIRA
jgi:hypothetical protein